MAVTFLLAAAGTMLVPLFSPMPVAELPFSMASPARPSLSCVEAMVSSIAASLSILFAESKMFFAEELLALEPLRSESPSSSLAFFL